MSASRSRQRPCSHSRPNLGDPLVDRLADLPCAREHFVTQSGFIADANGVGPCQFNETQRLVNYGSNVGDDPCERSNRVRRPLR